MGRKTDNPSIIIYINKIENRITFRINTRYYLELLTSETMKLCNQDKYNENIPHLEIIEIVLVHCNIVNNDYQQDPKVKYTFVSNKSFDQLLHV